MAKRFFYVCAGIFLLALSYHLGARSAGAQAPGNPVVATFGPNSAVVTANGDIYVGNSSWVNWNRVSNVFTNSSPTPTHPTTFGALKAKYRP